MKIQFNTKNFLRLFKLAANATALKYAKPVLQCVKIVADKEIGIILTATDVDYGIRIQIDDVDNGAH